MFVYPLEVKFLPAIVEFGIENNNIYHFLSVPL